MKVVPKFNRDCQAVRLAEDLIAEKGDYLLIGADDQITVVPEALFRVAFSAGSTAQPVIPQVIRKHQKMLLGAAGITVKFANSNQARMLLCFAPDESGNVPKNLTSSKVIEMIGGAVLPISVTAGLCTLVELGFLTKSLHSKEGDSKSRDRNAYNLTAKGLQVVRELRRVARAGQPKPQPQTRELPL